MRPPRQFNAATGLLETEVLAVQMPPAPQERRLYGQLLRALGAPYRPGDRLAVVESVALTLLGKVAPRMIVVDEVHDLLAGTAREASAPRSTCSSSCPTRIKCVIVTLGTRDALVAMQTDARESRADSRRSSCRGGRKTRTSGASSPDSSGTCRGTCRRGWPTAARP